MTVPRFTLTYWPIAFRACFISHMLAYRDIPFAIEDDPETIEDLMSRPPSAQDIPFIGPPVLRDDATNCTLSQMPAIALYLAPILELMPAAPADRAMALKVLMDCNDLLMEICRYNGTSMWEREAWIEFRGTRLPRWLAIFEQAVVRGHIGRDPLHFADIGVFALFGPLMRCLPALEPDVQRHAPKLHAHCGRIGAHRPLAAYITAEQTTYGDTYCAGQIEQSIRTMLALDAQG